MNWSVVKTKEVAEKYFHLASVILKVFYFKMPITVHITVAMKLGQRMPNKYHVLAKENYTEKWELFFGLPSEFLLLCIFTKTPEER